MKERTALQFSCHSYTYLSRVSRQSIRIKQVQSVEEKALQFAGFFFGKIRRQ